MTYPALQDYLTHLAKGSESQNKLWIDTQGRVQGQFRKCSLTSVFQAIVNLETDKLFGFDAYAHSYSETDRGLSIWHLLMNGATDDESIELDRLGRTIHIINFFRQPENDGCNVVIDVHDRLLTAIGSNHGAAFKRIVSSLGIPQNRIVLQLPATKSSQSWALSQVVDNYKFNGFQVATRANSIPDALFQINLLQPALVRLDITRVGTGDKLHDLITAAASRSVKILFSRIEHPHELSLIRDAANLSALEIDNLFIQGPLISYPQPELVSNESYRVDSSRQTSNLGLAHASI